MKIKSYVLRQCRDGHKGRLQYFIDAKKKIAFLGCSWCGRSVGPRVNGRALWNLFCYGYNSAIKSIKCNLPDGMDQEETDFISRRGRRKCGLR